MQHFKCIGSDCEDTCCAGWGITVDKDTYKKYSNYRGRELKSIMEKSVKRNRNQPTNDNYAKIQLDDQGSCPFLAEDKLCKIHGSLGEDYLSVTCSAYPREYNIVNRVVEKAAAVSCPEIARLALLNPNIMEFVEVEESIISNTVYRRNIDFNDAKFKIMPQNYFWELRVFTLQVLQAREYQLWERLVIIGAFYQSIQDAIEQGNIQEIPELISEYTNGIEAGAFDQTLQDVPVNEYVQMELLKEIINRKVEKGVSSERFVECFNEFVRGLKPNEQTSYPQVIENYVAAYNQYYLPYMEKNNHILENYLANYVFKTMFPFSKYEDVFENYVTMVIHYALIKMHLIGLAGFHKESFSTDHVIKLIQSFGKAIEHNQTFIDDTMDFIKKNGLLNLSCMLLLIKN